MIIGKVKKWGNSIGLLIRKEEAQKLGLKENQEVAVVVTKKSNPLKELFGFGKFSKPAKKLLSDLRATESKHM